MGLFNHNSHVSAERLAQDVILRPGDKSFEVGSSRYIPWKYDERPGYDVPYAYYLNRGVRGTWSHVRGESAGVVYQTQELHENALDVFATVVVPVKAHDFSTTQLRVDLTAEQVAATAQEFTQEKFYQQLIARAVLVAANGTNEQSNQ